MTRAEFIDILQLLGWVQHPVFIHPVWGYSQYWKVDVMAANPLSNSNCWVNDHDCSLALYSPNTVEEIRTIYDKQSIPFEKALEEITKWLQLM